MDSIKYLIKTILHRVGIKASINWDKRYKLLGPSAVCDSRNSAQEMKLIVFVAVENL